MNIMFRTFIRTIVRKLGLVAVTLLVVSCATTTDNSEGVVFVTPTERVTMSGGDIYNVTSVQEDSGTYLITLWLGDPGIQKLSTALAKSSNKKITLYVAGRKILNEKIIENVSHLYRIQMRAADARVARELIDSINNARQATQ